MNCLNWLRICLVILICWAATPSAHAQAPQPALPDQIFSDIFGNADLELPQYLIQPNDLLRIFVYGEPDLSSQALVRPDGQISVPLAQDIQAAGLNPGQLRLKIEERLSQFLDVPNVTVIVEAIQSYRVFVTGMVQQPGALMSETPITVLQALALAGGFQEFAKRNDTVVIRNAGTEGVLFEFEYDRVIEGANFDQNMLLESGDVVVVP